MWEFTLNLKGNKDVAIDKKVGPPISFKVLQQDFATRRTTARQQQKITVPNKTEERSQFVYKVRDVAIL